MSVCMMSAPSWASWPAPSPTCPVPHNCTCGLSTIIRSEPSTTGRAKRTAYGKTADERAAEHEEMRHEC